MQKAGVHDSIMVTQSGKGIKTGKHWGLGSARGKMTIEREAYVQKKISS